MVVVDEDIFFWWIRKIDVLILFRTWRGKRRARKIRI